MAGEFTAKDFARIRELRHIIREGPRRRGVPLMLCESVYDHTQRCAGVGYLYSRRVGDMLLAHDVPEILTEDKMPADQTPEEKDRDERTAMTRLACSPYLTGLWEEYQAAKNPRTVTAAGMIAAHLDKLDYAVHVAELEQDWRLKVLRVQLDTADVYPSLRKKFTDEGFLDIFNRVECWREQKLPDARQRYMRLIQIDVLRRTTSGKL